MTIATMEMFPEFKMFVTSSKCHKRGEYGLALKDQGKFLQVGKTRSNSESLDRKKKKKIACMCTLSTVEQNFSRVQNNNSKNKFDYSSENVNQYHSGVFYTQKIGKHCVL